jgi:hypothetical protein
VGDHGAAKEPSGVLVPVSGAAVGGRGPDLLESEGPAPSGVPKGSLSPTDVESLTVVNPLQPQRAGDASGASGKLGRAAGTGPGGSRELAAQPAEAVSLELRSKYGSGTCQLMLLGLARYVQLA